MSGSRHFLSFDKQNSSNTVKQSQVRSMKIKVGLCFFALYQEKKKTQYPVFQENYFQSFQLFAAALRYCILVTLIYAQQGIKQRKPQNIRLILKVLNSNPNFKLICTPQSLLLWKKMH